MLMIKSQFISLLNNRILKQILSKSKGLTSSFSLYSSINEIKGPSGCDPYHSSIPTPSKLNYYSTIPPIMIDCSSSITYFIFFSTILFTHALIFPFWHSNIEYLEFFIVRFELPVSIDCVVNLKVTFDLKSYFYMEVATCSLE